jgi:hypothetical protein
LAFPPPSRKFIRRGYTLNANAAKRINDKIAQWQESQEQGQGTLESVAFYAKLDQKTVRKILSAQEPADLRVIQKLFSRFDERLSSEDFCNLNSAHLSKEVQESSSLLKADSLNYPTITQNFSDTSNRKVIVFISHCRQEPDATLANQIREILIQAQYYVFVPSEDVKIGENLFNCITYNLKICDYLLLLLPEQAAFSDTLTYEVHQAKIIQGSREEAKPIILPIRVGFTLSEPLNHDLRGYLRGIQQRVWLSPADTPSLLEELLNILKNRVIPNQLSSITNAVEDIPIHIDDEPSPPLPNAEPELPLGQVPLSSHFYIERPPIEGNCYKEITKAGALIRIKAPRQMGKTSLMAKILSHGREHGYYIVPLSLQLAGTEIFTDTKRFLQWFCASVSDSLGLPERLTDYWRDIFGANTSCMNYFEKYLLQETIAPVIVALDELDCIFSYEKVVKDFLGLLRAFNEKAKYGGSSSTLWKKLRLIIVHSTEVYVPLDINQSPFNVGLEVPLPGFNIEQVTDLVNRYRLDLSQLQVNQLTEFTGGHPYLVRLALYQISQEQVSFDNFFNSATTEAGICSDHLRRHLWNLSNYPDLLTAFQKVLQSEGPVVLKPILAFKLRSLGLIKLEGNFAEVSSSLYQSYFREHLV